MNEIKIYDDIGEDWFGDGVTAKNISALLAGMSGDVVVRINSYGGDVFEGHAIYNLIKSYSGNVTVVIDGIAASAASVIAMAGDVVKMPVNGMLMIHDPWTFATGDSRVMDKTAETLRSIKQTIVNVYKEKTGIEESEIETMMEQETWLDVDQCVANGFAEKDISTNAVLNHCDKKRWINKVPKLKHEPIIRNEPKPKEEPKLERYANQEARKRYLAILAEAN